MFFGNAVPSACNELSDGYHYIQPLTESQLKEISDSDSDSVSAPPIKVMCSNGYTIINPKSDPNVLNYFSSYHDYHVSFSGPSLDDHVNWGEWWLPALNDDRMNRDTSNGEDDNENNEDSNKENENNRDDRRLLAIDTNAEGKDGSDDPWYNTEILDTITKWSVSEDCNSCLNEDELDYGTATAYYMTGDTYGL